MVEVPYGDAGGGGGAGGYRTLMLETSGGKVHEETLL